MIDFSKITKTLDGYDCHYFGTRESYGVTVHCFAVWDLSFGAIETNYDASGNRMRFDQYKWVRCSSSKFQIVKLKKKVSVKRWVSIHSDEDCVDGIYVLTNADKPLPGSNLVYCQQHTFTFEVDE